MGIYDHDAEITEEEMIRTCARTNAIIHRTTGKGLDSQRTQTILMKIFHIDFVGIRILPET